MSGYYYLDVLFAVESKEKLDIDICKLKQIIVYCIKGLFGEAGVGNQVDILRFEEDSGRVILRCFADFYVKLRASLSFGHNFEDILFSFYVRKASASILSLQANRSLFKF